jgi:putative acyl-CoA dehydrogenase
VRTSAFQRAANQPPPLVGYDLFSQHRSLAEALRREEGGWAQERCAAFGRLVGGAPLELGRLANEHPPVLRTHDRFGARIDEVEFHPAWHELLRLGVENELHALPWRAPRPGANVARAALFMTLAYAEAGVGCPLSMTFAAVPALRAEPQLAADWEPLLTSTAYDPELQPPAAKRGALCGMAMTERQAAQTCAQTRHARRRSPTEATH